MTRKLASLVTWLCTAGLILTPAGAAYLLIDLDRFAALAAANMRLPIAWHTVGNGQWVALWALSAAYLGVGLAGLFYLRKAFGSFARGDWFYERNSRHLRRFAALLAVAGLPRPVHFALASVLLSLRHEPGERVLALSIGSPALVFVGAGLVMWVLADLLVEGTRAERENRQFV